MITYRVDICLRGNLPCIQIYPTGISSQIWTKLRDWAVTLNVTTLQVIRAVLGTDTS